MYNEIFWVLNAIGATFAAIAIAYRLGHTVGYSQAASLTLPRFETIECLGAEITTDVSELDEAVPVEQRKETVLST